MTAPDALQPTGLAAAVEVLRAHGDNPSAFLALNRDKERFTVPGIDGFVAYRRVGRYRVQFGGPFAAPPDRERLLAAFLADTRAARRRAMAVQVGADDAELYAAQGFSVNQLGASYALELRDWSLSGKRFVRLRNKISRARRAGLRVEEVDATTYAAALAAIDERWLAGKGAKPLTFTVGEIGGPAQAWRRLFLGLIDDEPIGYISYAPAYGSRPGWLHDLSRRVPQAPPGVMEAINLTAVERFRESGSPWLHFGFTPFTGLAEEFRTTSASGPATALLRAVQDRGGLLYPAHSQLDYKLKWFPSVTIPEYVAFRGRIAPGAVLGFLRAINLL
ncbi:bifunctional lysylphosphatidylglycerol flippase/synthetase MprF [Nocardia sp. NPDC003482]